ncbi:thiamine-phosphate kinase [Planctomicrobium sp. SH664]|uniref:thiamine-phosphate kinase n=1 Tax=Planctomicrobium sp. SH664 TaxID=3448125 RepID=UPI003F5C0A16
MTTTPFANSPEFSFIDWVREQAPLRDDVLLGIGDDAAVLDPAGRRTVVTVDVITDQVDFDLQQTLPERIGRKALAVNLSDLAAMAAEPCAAFVGLVLPRSLSRSSLERIYAGMFELAREWNVAIAGGDTNSWDGPLALSVTLLGWSERRKPLTRAGARPGDWIFVTGGLGGSLPSDRHLTFEPRIREAQLLASTYDLHALMDISDGLSSDLFHILNASQVGAELDGDAIPIHADVDRQLPQRERLLHALNDGEDFELLFTVSAADGQRLLNNSPLAIPVTKIGVVTRGSAATIVVEGERLPLQRGGWSHQFGS